ncbi:MAG: TetR/AcrR family transcriptional regulator [Spirochaetaceae bacterium]|nr:TetR/AcrR family transcriptional regulator [Spirochaetaceae bacterium]
MEKTKEGKAAESKDNRKTRYTKKVLRESLVEIMKSKAITNITIKEICALADVSRTTFYAYYKDQYDLLKQIENETVAYIEDALKEIGKEDGYVKIIQIVEDMLRYICYNSNSVQVLLSENGDPQFQKRFFQRLIYQRWMINHFIETLGNKPEMLEYYLTYAVNGSIALVQCWLKNGMDIPISQIAKMLVHMSPVVGGMEAV